MQRGDVEGLLVDVRSALGLSAARLTALLAMIRCTRPSDWTTTEVDAVCYAQQAQIAADLGKTPRALRGDEVALEHMGLIARRTCNNGRRCAPGNGHQLKLGMSFAPLIERIGQLLELRALVQRERETMKALRCLCSSLRREFRRCLDALATTADHSKKLKRLAALYASWPRRMDRFHATADLEAHRVEVEAAVHEAHDLLDMSAKTSGGPEDVFRRSLQDTTDENLELCNDPVVTGRSACQCIEDPPRNAAFTRTASGREADGLSLADARNPPRPISITPARLYAVATEEMRFWIDCSRQDRTDLRAVDFVQAAIRRVPELGINHTAWEEAVAAMGDRMATLAVLIIDANRSHPATPIHQPGGALRAFARRHRAGALNLTGSLLGLIARTENAATQSERTFHANRDQQQPWHVRRNNEMSGRA